VIRAIFLAGAVVLTVVSGASATPSRDSDGDALRRYAPVLRYTEGEEYFAQPASRAARQLDGDVIYGRVAEEAGERWLQYWLFFAQNTQDRGVVGTGLHEGDWEFVQIRLGVDGPDAVTLAQHSWAEACPYSELETEIVEGHEVPVVFVAEGSHALYPRAGTGDRPWPDPNDRADGSGPEVRPRVELIAKGEPAWTLYPGPWGASEASWVPGEQSSPVGPMFKDDRRWFEPATFHREALPCGETPPGRWWQTPLLALAFVVLAGAVVLHRRRS
jgi:hypothetical protein